MFTVGSPVIACWSNDPDIALDETDRESTQQRELDSPNHSISFGSYGPSNSAMTILHKLLQNSGPYFRSP